MNNRGQTTIKSHTRKTQAVKAGSVHVTRTLGYLWQDGRLTRMTYPSGKVVAYGYDQGRLARISVNGQPLLFGVAYHPFGAARAWTWGNGSPYARRFDANGWLQDYPLGNLIRRLDYDAAGRITAYTHPGQPRFDQTFAYDALDRLTAQTTYQGNAGWTYDANGNRTLFISGNAHYPYALAAGSNRLMRVAGPVARTYSHDAAGNVTGDASIRFLIDRDGRVREASGAWGSARYLVDGLGQQ